jgi:GNAT superfamily N-acetyltransferase
MDPIVVCRPALPKDTADVLELTSHIWEGHDYVPHVWADWLADPEGLLAVAECGGRVVGMYKLTRLGPAEWYLEGLRVHPDQEGRGTAAHLHDYLMDTWQRVGGGLIRLATVTHNVKVQHLAERSGFEQVASFTPFKALAESGPVDDFTPLQPAEAAQALALIQQSPALALSHGLLDRGWAWAWPALKHLEETIQAGQAWWWQGRSDRLLAAWEDDENEDERRLVVQAAACPLDELAELLAGFRRLAAGLGYEAAGWVAPQQPDAQAILEAAGYQRDWDEAVHVYEKCGSD